MLQLLVTLLGVAAASSRRLEQHHGHDVQGLTARYFANPMLMGPPAPGGCTVLERHAGNLSFAGSTPLPCGAAGGLDRDLFGCRLDGQLHLPLGSYQLGVQSTSCAVRLWVSE